MPFTLMKNVHEDEWEQVCDACPEVNETMHVVPSPLYGLHEQSPPPSTSRYPSRSTSLYARVGSACDHSLTTHPPFNPNPPHTSDTPKTVDVNCKGVLNGIGAVLPGMLERKLGHIVSISSDAGRKVFPGLAVYSASKFFVEAVSQGLRLETVGSGVKVTTIQPGNVATDLASASTDEEAMKAYGEPSGAKVLDTEDVARAVMYAITQPAHVAVNEIMVEPRDEPC